MLENQKLEELNNLWTNLKLNHSDKSTEFKFGEDYTIEDVQRELNMLKQD